MLGTRLKRNLHLLRGWPLRACLLTCASQEVIDSALQELAAKHKRFTNTKAMLKNRTIKRLHEASMFQIVPCQQLVCMLETTGWQLTQPITEHCYKLSCRLVTSQICEGGFHRAKQAAKKGAAHQISDERVFHTLLKRRVIDVVHDYQTPDLSCLVPPRQGSLPSHAFKGLEQDVWPELSKVKGTKGPTWYHTGGNNFWDHVAHDSVLEFCELHDCMASIKHTWKCSLLQCCTLLVKHESHTRYYLVLGQASSECVFGWPATCHTLADGVQCFSLADTVTEPGYLCIVEEAQWTGYFFEWLSPEAQLAHFKTELHGPRAFPLVQGEPKPILDIAATRAFYDLPRTSLGKIASDLLKLDVPRWCSMFDLVWMMVKHVLETSDADTLAILQLRTFRQRGEAACRRELYESGECDDIMEEHDKEDLKKARDKAAIQDEEVEGFQAAYRQKQLKVCPPLAAVKGLAAQRAKQPKAKAGSASGSADLRPFPTDAGDVTHKEAKQWLPPGSYIWRAWRSSSWLTQYPPHSIHSRCMHTYGSRGALQQVLQAVW